METRKSLRQRNVRKSVAAMVRHSWPDSRGAKQSPLTVVQANPETAMLGSDILTNPPFINFLRPVVRKCVIRNSPSTFRPDPPSARCLPPASSQRECLSCSCSKVIELGCIPVPIDVTQRSVEWRRPPPIHSQSI